MAAAGMPNYIAGMTTSGEHHGKDGCAACAMYDSLRAHCQQSHAGLTRIMEMGVFSALHGVLYIPPPPGSGGGREFTYFTNDDLNSQDYKDKVGGHIRTFCDSIPRIMSEHHIVGVTPNNIACTVMQNAAKDKKPFAEAIREGLHTLAAPFRQCAMCNKKLPAEEAILTNPEEKEEEYACPECWEGAMQQEGGSKRRQSRNRKSRSRQSKRR